MIGGSGFSSQGKKIIWDSILRDESEVLRRTDDIVKAFPLSSCYRSFLHLDALRGLSLVSEVSLG
jgi:hypothetical protein